MTILIMLLPAIITSLSIIGVGYWVNETIRRKNQRDAVLVNYLQELQRHMHKLIHSAIETDDFNECTASLRSLSNEIRHFSDLQTYSEEKSEHNEDDLMCLYFLFKKYLTDTGSSPEEEAREQARTIGNNLKEGMLKAIFAICESKK